MDVNDNGYTSRKFWLTGFSILTIIAGGVFGTFVPAFIPLFATYSGAITGLTALYFGANIGAKSVLAKAANLTVSGTKEID
jgi:hypothetical protein